MRINSAKDLDVYKKAYQLAMRVFELTKQFPVEERYALTSQIRRSSRSICLNLREAWAKRRYEAHFVSKLTDCDGENSETDTSLDFARDCSYITAEQHLELTNLCREIGAMLGSMLNRPERFLARSQRPEVGGQTSDVSGREEDVGDQRADVSGRMIHISGFGPLFPSVVCNQYETPTSDL